MTTISLLFNLVSIDVSAEIVFNFALLTIFSLGVIIFLIDSNPANSGYVVSHFDEGVDVPLEMSELFYSPVIDTFLRYVTVSGWFYSTRGDPNNVVDRKSSVTRKKDGKENLDQDPRKKDSKASKDGVKWLAIEECEFISFPPEELETSLWFKWRVTWGYLKITFSAIVKENLWFLQYLLKINPGYSYFSKSKKTGLEALYIEHAYRSYEDCWNRPICSAPASEVDVVLRERPDQPMFAPFRGLELTNRVARRCINLASYNYLGFGGFDQYCTDKVKACLRGEKLKDNNDEEEDEVSDESDEITTEDGVTGLLGLGGLSTGSFRGGCHGTLPVHKKLENTIAGFLGKEDAFCTGMGFATNSTLIPALIDPNGNGKGCLILSDALNHKSIVEGVRMSAVTVKPFKHNDMVDLERKLRHAVDYGQPNGQAWRKVVVVVEGIYSMEGDFCRLRETVALKNKYGAYLYLDEAHSIGAVGMSGRGVTELFDVPTDMIDVMMGTFTKSFGSAGGYIAAKKEIINNVRQNSPNDMFGASMSPCKAAQALAAFELMMDTKNPRGREKIHSLRRNCNYFRASLRKMGFWVLGDEDSPVVPVLMDQEHMWHFSTKGLNLGIASVVVCYPATPYLLPRARFCISAAHSMDQINRALRIIEKLGYLFGLMFHRNEPLESQSEYKQWLHSAPMKTKRSYIGKLQPQEGLSSLSLEEYVEKPVTMTVAERKGNFCLLDPLGFVQSPHKSLLNTCESYLYTHGFGTCGPRGFYGTTMEHLALEEKTADFLATESAIFYAHGVSVASSVLASPTVLGGKDLVFCFSKCNFGIKAGLRLNGKCTTVWVKNIDEIKEWINKWKKVERVDKPDKVAYRTTDSNGQSVLTSLPREFTDALKKEILPFEEYQRRYIVTEGIFQSDGMYCDLPALSKLKSELSEEGYPLQLLVDESYSLLGMVGRHDLSITKNDSDQNFGSPNYVPGICGYYNLPLSTIDLFMGSFEFGFASIGGFCAGKFVTVRDLRLTSSGYCFSASAPGVACLWSTLLMESVKPKELDSDCEKLDSSTSSDDNGVNSTSVNKSISLTSSSTQDSITASSLISSSPPSSPVDGKIVSPSYGRKSSDDSTMTRTSSAKSNSTNAFGISIADSLDIGNRFKKLEANVALLHDALVSQNAEEMFEISGRGYIVCLRPRAQDKEESEDSSADSSTGSNNTASTTVDKLETAEVILKRMEQIQQKTGNLVDIYKRPKVEKALDNWHGITNLNGSISSLEQPWLRLAVSCLHSKNEIENAVRKLITAAKERNMLKAS